MSTYTPMTWSNGDAVSIERMNTMAENDQYLYERVIESKHVWDGAETTAGIKILAMNARFPSVNAKLATIPISWNGFFSPGCNPIVNLTVGRRQRNRLWVSVKGPSGENWPNSRGCEIHGVMDPDTHNEYTFGIPIAVHIMAIGY